MTPKDKALKYLDTEKDYDLNDVEKAIDIALKEQAKQIFKGLEELEDKSDYFIFKKQWLK